jgi:hypothetical protein
MNGLHSAPTACRVCHTGLGYVGLHPASSHTFLVQPPNATGRKGMPTLMLIGCTQPALCCTGTPASWHDAEYAVLCWAVHEQPPGLMLSVLCCAVMCCAVLYGIACVLA